MNEVSFAVEVKPEDALRFAELSGDFNPLHVDADYAVRTDFKRPILHGAFSAGLLSRMAGMHLPGRNCLLHSIQLRFVAPIQPPARLLVTGRETGANMVSVVVADAASGRRYVEGSYHYGLHEERAAVSASEPVRVAMNSDVAPILVTGATGGLGSAVLAALGADAVGVTRGQGGGGLIGIGDVERIADDLPFTRIAGIVHCGWPQPDNEPLLDLSTAGAAVEHHVAQPLRQTLALARLLAERGVAGAPLILIGSSFAEPGRHAYRTPLYGLAKSLIPTLTDVLALELGTRGKRCMALVFDVLAGGMNAAVSPAILMGHADRTPSGELGTMADAAEQVRWALANSSHLASGATIRLTGGALP